MTISEWFKIIPPYACAQVGLFVLLATVLVLLRQWPSLRAWFVATRGQKSDLRPSTAVMLGLTTLEEVLLFVPRVIVGPWLPTVVLSLLHAANFTGAPPLRVAFNLVPITASFMVGAAAWEAVGGGGPGFAAALTMHMVWNGAVYMTTPRRQEELHAR